MADRLDFSVIRCRADIPKLLEQLGAKHVCEVGVKEGDNIPNLLIPSVEILVAIDIYMDTGIKSQNDCDVPQEKQEEMYKALCERAEKDIRIHPIRDLSLIAPTYLKKEFFDFVYLDADHTYEAVKRDIEAYWPMVREGGVLAGHDYCDYTLPNGVTFGVVQAVDEFHKKTGLNVYFDEERPWRSWFIQKPVKPPLGSIDNPLPADPIPEVKIKYL